MRSAAGELLTWSAESLPVAHWFAFVSDLQALFPGSDRLLIFGVTIERYGWWDTLSRQYPTAIQRIEELHNGQGNLRWLWFQEVVNNTVLLDLLEGRTQASGLHMKIVKYLQPSQRAIAQICDSLATFNQTSTVGQQAFQSILARHEQPRRTWPRSASETLLVAWGRSPGIQHSDVTALNALADLLGLSMAMNQAGFGIARDIVMADYARIIKLATELEAMRVTLRYHNASRTSLFLHGIRVEDARGCADAAIPEELSDAIEAVGDRTYELSFPLTHLKKHQRQASGISSTSRMLIVRVSFQVLHRWGFCIHFYPNDGPATAHTPWQNRNTPPSGAVCYAKPNLFTYMLGRKIHCFMHMQSGSDLASLHNLVLSALECRPEECIVCFTPLGSKVWRPTTCLSNECAAVFRQAPLEITASHLLQDPAVLDFLLTCVYSAAADGTTLDLLPNCPVPKASLRTVIDSFPHLNTAYSPTKRLAQMSGSDVHAANRLAILSWLGISFRGFMISAPESARVPSMPGVHQFIMLNSAPEREALFSEALSVSSSTNTSGTPHTTGGVVFHGTPAPRLFKVLTEGLKNMSNTPFMAHGASHGSGIYLADEPATSLGYGGSTGNATWRGSALSNRQVLLGCELLGHVPGSYHVIPDEGRVLNRYVFLCPVGFRAPQARLIDGAMRSTFASLRTGVLAERERPVAGMAPEVTLD